LPGGGGAGWIGCRLATPVRSARSGCSAGWARAAWAGVRRLGAALAEGLSAIHDCGLIHRDLKPGNVIMADDGPRIIDFGIAKDPGARPGTGDLLARFSRRAPHDPAVAAGPAPVPAVVPSPEPRPAKAGGAVRAAQQAPAASTVGARPVLPPGSWPWGGGTERADRQHRARPGRGRRRGGSAVHRVAGAAANAGAPVVRVGRHIDRLVYAAVPS